MVERLPRASSWHQRCCSRRLPTSARSLTTAGCWSCRARSSRLGRSGLRDARPPRPATVGQGVAGLGDRALAASAATGLLAGHQAQPGADRGPGEAMPVADLHGQPNPGQHPDPAQTGQPGHHRRPGRGGGQLGDGASRRSRRAWTARTAPWASAKGLPAGLAAPAPPHAGQPPGVRLGPGRPGKTSPGPAAASTADAGPPAAPRGRLRGSDRVWSCLLGLGRDPHRGRLPDVQQPGQPFGVAPVGLDPIPGRAFQLDGATPTPPTPAAWRARASPNPVGPAA
jgi:hypothetical protein